MGAFKRPRATTPASPSSPAPAKKAETTATTTKKADDRVEPITARPTEPTPDTSGDVMDKLMQGKLPVRIGLTRGELKAVLMIVAARLRREGYAVNNAAFSDWDVVAAADANAKNTAVYTLTLASSEVPPKWRSPIIALTPSSTAATVAAARCPECSCSPCLQGAAEHAAPGPLKADKAEATTREAETVGRPKLLADEPVSAKGGHKALDVRRGLDLPETLQQQLGTINAIIAEVKQQIDAKAEEAKLMATAQAAVQTTAATELPGNLQKSAQLSPSSKQGQGVWPGHSFGQAAAATALWTTANPSPAAEQSAAWMAPKTLPPPSSQPLHSLLSLPRAISPNETRGPADQADQAPGTHQAMALYRQTTSPPMLAQSHPVQQTPAAELPTPPSQSQRHHQPQLSSEPHQPAQTLLTFEVQEYPQPHHQYHSGLPSHQPVQHQLSHEQHSQQHQQPHQYSYAQHPSITVLRPQVQQQPQNPYPQHSQIAVQSQLAQQHVLYPYPQQPLVTVQPAQAQKPFQYPQQPSNSALLSHSKQPSQYPHHEPVEAQQPPQYPNPQQPALTVPPAWSHQPPKKPTEQPWRPQQPMSPPHSSEQQSAPRPHPSQPQPQTWQSVNGQNAQPSPNQPHQSHQPRQLAPAYNQPAPQQHQLVYVYQVPVPPAAQPLQGPQLPAAPAAQEVPARALGGQQSLDHEAPQSFRAAAIGHLGHQPASDPPGTAVAPGLLPKIPGLAAMEQKLEEMGLGPSRLQVGDVTIDVNLKSPPSLGGLGDVSFPDGPAFMARSAPVPDDDVPASSNTTGSAFATAATTATPGAEKEQDHDGGREEASTSPSTTLVHHNSSSTRHVTSAATPATRQRHSTSQSDGGDAEAAGDEGTELADSSEDLGGEDEENDEDEEDDDEEDWGRVINGEDASITDVPYQVALEHNGRLWCGGSIIGKTWVMTAAHCVQGRRRAAAWRVRAGATLRETGGKLVKVRQVFPHPKYKQLKYDVALFKLAETLTYSSSIKAVKLPGKGHEDATPGAAMTISGWGKVKPNGYQYPRVLQKATVSVVARDECSKRYSNTPFGPISNVEVCAGGDHTDTCQGDSGGPMVDSSGTQMGITSWGEGCAELPGVYSNIAHPDLREFVRKTAGV
ncbi:protein piccolo-like [Thrips palmi]|uniref:Protein piccolo-like n=1 Tax=Thrips palmi TaxID=161013 RepID=A0A6P8YP66_THRPL|nr:protein piccolo-like [Thrips palmi]